MAHDQEAPGFSRGRLHLNIVSQDRHMDQTRSQRPHQDRGRALKLRSADRPLGSKPRLSQIIVKNECGALTEVSAKFVPFPCRGDAERSLAWIRIRRPISAR
jgi:hypothetical protein